MKKIGFARHLSTVYTLIIAVPVLALILVGSEYLGNTLLRSASSDILEEVRSDAAFVERNIDEMERLESVITSDYELLRTFYFFAGSDSQAIIDVLTGEILYLDRLMFALPDLYALHLFIENPNVPERWPIVFSEKRLDLTHFPRWTFNYSDPATASIQSSREPAACLTRDVQLTRRHVGYLQITKKMTDFFPALYRDQEQGISFIASAEGIIASSPESALAVSPEEILRRAPAGSVEPDTALYTSPQDGVSIERISGTPYIVAWAVIPRLSAALYRISSPRSITSTLANIRMAAFLLMLLSVGMMFLIIDFATRRMVNRLLVVMDGMRKVRSGDLSVSVEVGGDDEVAEMAHIFSEMVGKLNSLIAEIKTEQELVTATEIRAMQNQINAHFLYNVLETIKMQAELRDQREIADSVTLLGRMMRYCLRRRETRVPLREEIAYVADYIALMNVRNDYRITLNTALPPETLDFPVPRLIVQPIVENAVKHSVEPAGEDAAIEISGHLAEDGSLRIVVRDFGTGMSEGKMEDVLAAIDSPDEPAAPAGGIGLRNIQQRLHAFYGEKWSLGIQSGPDSGTVVTIPVPEEKTL